MSFKFCLLSFIWSCQYCNVGFVKKFRVLSFCPNSFVSSTFLWYLFVFFDSYTTRKASFWKFNHFDKMSSSERCILYFIWLTFYPKAAKRMNFFINRLFNRSKHSKSTSKFYWISFDWIHQIHAGKSYRWKPTMEMVKGNLAVSTPRNDGTKESVIMQIFDGLRFVHLSIKFRKRCKRLSAESWNFISPVEFSSLAHPSKQPNCPIQGICMCALNSYFCFPYAAIIQISYIMYYIQCLRRW